MRLNQMIVFRAAMTGKGDMDIPGYPDEPTNTVSEQRHIKRRFPMGAAVAVVATAMIALGMALDPSLTI